VDDAAPAKSARGGREGGEGAAGGGRGGAGRGERGGEGEGDGYSDEDDWLVHEDEEEGGPPGERRRRRRAIMASMPGVDADAMEARGAPSRCPVGSQSVPCGWASLVFRGHAWRLGTAGLAALVVEVRWAAQWSWLQRGCSKLPRV
jgi:hypothetical protein